MSHLDKTILVISGNYYGHREYEYGISRNHCITIVRYKIIRYKKFMPPDKPLYQ